MAAAAFGEKGFGPDTAFNPCTDTHSDADKLACDWWKINKELSSFASYENISPEWVGQITEVRAMFRLAYSVSSMSADLYKWLRSAQDLISNMASNYDMKMLILGQVTAAVACILATAGLYSAGTSHAQSHIIFAAITLTYGVMMFASSYVEEEQHFWYWVTTAWLASLVLKTRTR